MAKRDRKEELRKQVASRIALTEKWQRKPWTGVKIVVDIPADKDLGFIQYTGYGFSKVQWPDRWDEAYGYSMARDKAIVDVVRQVMADESDIYI